ncbi:hypothetical protein BGZ88_007060 [Linnemannia elongata]|nr:hypothetical protein BGZ88_007060 [Linnemannia elongata]
MAIGIRRILHSLGEHQVQGFGSMTSARVTALILAFQSAVMGSLEPTDDELSVLIERSRIAQSLSPFQGSDHKGETLDIRGWDQRKADGDGALCPVERLWSHHEQESDTRTESDGVEEMEKDIKDDDKMRPCRWSLEVYRSFLVLTQRVCMVTGVRITKSMESIHRCFGGDPYVLSNCIFIRRGLGLGKTRHLF